MYFFLLEKKGCSLVGEFGVLIVDNYLENYVNKKLY